MSSSVYTKPRGPIAAMYTSPGTKYGLPALLGHRNHDPRSEHTRQPAFSFGSKHGKMTDDCSPGPCYMPLSKMYRNGKDGTAQYSLYARPKASEVTNSGPGPGAYNPDEIRQSQKGPSYSFGLRYLERRVDQTPGPNVYDPERMVGKTLRSQKKSAPAYSLYGRRAVGGFDEDLHKTPGPCAYSTSSTKSHLHSAPAYSLQSRQAPLADTTQKPGPGTHAPEKAHGHTKRSAPQFTFGTRHTEFKTECIMPADAE